MDEISKTDEDHDQLVCRHHDALSGNRKQDQGVILALVRPLAIQILVGAKNAENADGDYQHAEKTWRSRRRSAHLKMPCGNGIRIDWLAPQRDCKGHDRQMPQRRFRFALRHQNLQHHDQGLPATIMMISGQEADCNRREEAR